SATATDYFKSKVVLVKVNAEVDTTLAREMAISGYPTLVLLDKKGEEIDRVIGYMETDPFLKQLDDYQKGIGTLADLLDQSKKDTSRELSFKIADKYKYRGKPDDATGWYQKVIAVNPTDSLAGESRMSLADMLRRAKKWDEALAAFAAVEKDFKGTPYSFSADAGIWQAITLGRKGDTTAAIAAYEVFLKNYPNSEDTSYARKQIAKLKNPPPPEEKK
ncbi:MAG: tetratricopeptide repeat protein, partial [candidate division Zixibacteria bacterium]|nr:tetratricopeptide repeat protein [candidate division Zixibacteria bacterium]